jgi:hypothetical protein
MATSFMGRPHRWGYRIDLRKRLFLLLLGAAGLLIGVAIAENGRFSGDSGSPRTAPGATAPVGNAGALASSGSEARAPLALRDALELTRQSRAAMQEVRDYTAVFTKRERIKGRLRKQVMEMKLRAEPFSVYLLYQSKKEAGRQAIYVEGMCDNSLLVKETGLKALAGVLRLGLQNPLVTAENRYPVTHLGIANVIDIVIATWEREAKLEEVRPIVEIFPNVRLGEVACQELLVTHPQFHTEIEFHLTRVYFEKETMLPIHAERYGWPQQAGEEPPLVEEYIYRDVKTNVGLTDADFDPAQYGF